MCTPIVFSKSSQGFTLIEMITVIVLVGILSTIGGSIIVKSTDSYHTTQARSLIVNSGRQAVERISRQLRDAHPYSIRVTNVAAGVACIEFMPIAGGGNYVNPVAVNDSGVSNGVTPSATIAVSSHAVDFGSAKNVSIGAMLSTELYGSSSPASLAILSSRTATQLTLSSAKTWKRNSVDQRFYLLDSPQAFCVINNQLRFYANQDFTTASVDTSSSYSLLADSVSATTPFALTAASENRNVNVLINIDFKHSGESINFNHSVMIRNVP